MVNVEENYRQIGRSMQDNLRKINGQQTEYSVGIVGIGDIGSATAQIIPSIERVESLRLFTRDPDEKGRFILNNLVGKRPIDSSVSHSDTLEEMVHDLDILVIAIGKDNVEYRTKTPNITRDSVFELNKIPLIGTSERIKGFEKSVIVVTNPVEKAAQIVAEYSKIDPGLITGLSHTDLVRLRRDFRNYFASKGLEKKYLEGIRTDLVGTHSENAVGFFGLGGLKRSEFKSVSEDLVFKHIVASALEYKERFKLIAELGVSDSHQTAIAIKEVIQAIIDEDWEKDPVRTSLFIEPEVLGIEDAVNGLYFGYPTYFKDFVAYPDQDFKIDDDKDFERVVADYREEEASLLDLKARGIFKLDLERRIKIADPRKKNERKAPIKRRQKPFEVDGKVVAVSNYFLHEWPDLNNPNRREESNLDWRVEAFSVPRIEDLYYKLFAHSEGVSINKEGTKKNRLMKIERTRAEESFKSVKLRQIEDDYFIFAGTQDFVYMLNFKTGKVIMAFSGWNGSLNNFEVGLVDSIPHLYVAANHAYEFSFDQPQEPKSIFRVDSGKNKVTDIAINRAKLYGSTGAHTSAWNIMNPSRAPLISQDIPYSNMSCFSITTLNGSDVTFAGTYESNSYLLGGSMGEILSTYRKAESNKNGTGKIGLRAMGNENYLFASDKNRYSGTRDAEISIWDIANPDVPKARLQTHKRNSIRGFEIIREK